MKILLITSLYPTFYRTRALYNFIKYWEKDRKISVDVINPQLIYLSDIWKRKQEFLINKNFFIQNKTNTKIFSIYKIPLIGYFFLPLMMYIKYKKTKYDIIIAHFKRSLNLGYKIAKKNNIPLIAGIHLGDILECKQSERVKNKFKEILDYSSLIACRSEKIHSILNEWFPEFKEKFFIAYSGIDESYIKDNDYLLNKMYKWKMSRSVKITSVCTLIKRKNIDKVLFALKNLNNDIKWNYGIIGDGPETDELKKLTSDLRLNDRVQFTGRLNFENVMTELNNSDIFILISKNETFGMAYLEAMAAGNIVIGSSDEGIDGIIINSDNGFLIKDANVNDLKNLIEDLVLKKSVESLKIILDKSYKTILNYTEKKAADNYLENIKKVKK